MRTPAIASCGQHNFVSEDNSLQAKPACRQQIQRLLALRHEYLDEVLYAAVHEAADQALLRPRAFLCTLSFLQKLQGNLSHWSRQLKQSKQLMLIVDEFHQASMEGLLAALASFDCVVLAGDTQQAPPKEWAQESHHRAAQKGRELARSELPEPLARSSKRARSSRDGPDSSEQAIMQTALADNTHGGYGRAPAPLRKHLGAAWALDANLPRFRLSETHRFGASVVDCLKAMSPGTWSDMTSAKTTDTDVIPFVFDYLDDAQGQSCSPPEFTSSRTLFVHAAVALALELVLGHENVVVMAFYTRLLREFRRYLHVCLPGILSRVCDRVGRPQVSLKELEDTGRLSFLTTHSAGGVNQAVAFLLAVRRQIPDNCWHGDVLLHRGYRYIGLTRATTRLYVFAEELRAGIRWPVYSTNAGFMTVAQAHDIEGLLDENEHLGAEPRRQSLADFTQQAEWVSLLRWLTHQKRHGVAQGKDVHIPLFSDMALLSDSSKVHVPAIVRKMRCSGTMTLPTIWEEELASAARTYHRDFQPMPVPSQSRRGNFANLAGLLQRANQDPGNPHALPNCEPGWPTTAGKSGPRESPAAAAKSEADLRS